VDGAKAADVLRHTGADAIMVGRAALGNPWVFREIAHYLATRQHLPAPSQQEVRETLCEHLRELHTLYGDARGVRVGRKHIQWYCQRHPGAEAFWRSINRVEDPREQITRVIEFLQPGPGVSLAQAA
jgi:tRNA-dihydrouridine synthase B